MQVILARPMTQIDSEEKLQGPQAQLIPRGPVISQPPTSPPVDSVTAHSPVKKRDEMRLDLVQVRLLTSDHASTVPAVVAGERQQCSTTLGSRRCGPKIDPAQVRDAARGVIKIKPPSGAKVLRVR